MSVSRMYVRGELDRATIHAGAGQIGEHIVYGQAAMQSRYVSSEQAENMFCQGNYKKWNKLIRFLFTHKETLKKVPILGQILVKCKDMMLQKELGQRSRQVEVDLSDCMGWLVDDFISACYQRLLGREPDPEGLEYYRNCIWDGAGHGAVIYMITRSEEFDGHVQVKHGKTHRRSYFWYICNRTALKIPVVGHILALFTLPRIFKKLYDRIARNEALILALSTQLIENEKGLVAQMEEQTILDASRRKISESLHNLSNTVEQIVRQSEEHRRLQKLGLSINTAISKKLDELPMFITANNVSSHTTVTGIPGGVIGVIADKFTMGVPAEEWGVAMYLSQVGHFEVGTERFFEALLKPGMTVLDLGANLGMFTLRALGSGCKVFSYEPTPRTCEILRQNIKVNGFAETGRSIVMQMAVSDVCGSTTFFENSKMCGHNSLFGEQDQQGITVQTVTLDSQQDLLGPVDVIKMDIEGAEYYALRGMRTLLEQNPHIQIIMEFAPTHLKRANVQPETLLQMVCGMGFSIYAINEATAEVEMRSEEELLCADTVNLYLKREI